jgi:4-amino-4-deoxy-L-arabinose transferase-like glycosyltransferase
MFGSAAFLRKTQEEGTSKPIPISFLLAGLVVAILYGVNLFYCQHSSLKFMDVFFANSDMHSNLLWAKSIRDQGLLNPLPFHPWATWMQGVAPYSQWTQWWGGQQIFQQSPLYAYLLSAMLHNPLLMRAVQALMGIGTCVFLGTFTARMSGQVAGWITFWLSALYAPFYAYAWPFLRDGLGWFITAALLWALSELIQVEWSTERAGRFAWLSGVLLGLGYLARETYLLAIPMAIAVLAGFAVRRRQWGILVRVCLALTLSLLPLMIRNYAVNAPLLSSSNRFAETFIQGNVSGTIPTTVVFDPGQMGRILTATHGRTLSLIRVTISTHPEGLRGWLKLQEAKAMTLLDPYEIPDNLSFYFVARVSPVVRWGLRYWMILAPALAGLVMSIWRRQFACIWIWTFLPIFLVGLFIGFPLSRYRQSLMVFLLPCAGYFLACLWSYLQNREFAKVALCGLYLLAAWGLLLGPLARRPGTQYERPQEYLISSEIYHALGQEEKATEMLEAVRLKFPQFHFQ